MLRSIIVRIVLRLLFATIVFAAMLVATEYALRYWFRHVRSSGNAGDYFAQHQPQISKNSLGYRDRELGPKDPRRYRIVVVGDSFTWGQGIVQLFINDFETAQMERPHPHPLISDGAARGWGRSSALYDLASGPWVQIQEATGLAESYAHYLDRNLRDPNAPNAQIAFGMLRQFLEKAKAAGVGVGVVLFPMTDAMGPNGSHYPVGFIHDRARQIAADEGVPYLDLLPAFSTYKDPKTLWVSPFDAHPNAIANKRAAREILRAFADRWR